MLFVCLFVYLLFVCCLFVVCLLYWRWRRAGTSDGASARSERGGLVHLSQRGDDDVESK